MKSRLVSYALDFVSFLLQGLGKDANKVNQIILFGSVVSGETGKGSDVDIFIDVIDKKLEDKVNKIKDEFYNSVKFNKYWKLLNIENEINCTVGRLDEWEDLERSLTAKGIVLFGKYKGKAGKEPYFLFIVTPSSDRNKNISVWRALYGYTQQANNKIYKRKGLVKEYDGMKLAKGVFMIPSEHAQKVLSFLKDNKFSWKVVPIWKDVD